MKIPHELIAGVCAKLIEAPKADAKSVRAAILQMREQLIAAMIEKNWDMRQLREWLAAQGVDVPLESLGRYLRGIRAARKASLEKGTTQKREARRADPPAMPAPKSPSPSAPPERGVPPMPSSIWKRPPETSAEAGAKESGAPRASSFSVRPDREKI
ncbi:hypothetical protein M2323_004636 [Rhodoblastus acidophilus]|uniref:hypothetical protein n=1 Tax=Rhodoblastus acidophilus TaxID=1074 RepID=UPI002224FECD|nr:hypothetical protein [Rhodoblastus acidophilus]MCW2286821.1 hypothetical protein [Rhodoblastus acidophilus]MCW2335684.1 hypothetical protein [Rhodoblastus acidophilus]